MSNASTALKPKGLLNSIERIGNALPDPVTLFFLGAVAVVVLSELTSQAGWEVTNPVTKEVETVKSLYSSEGMEWIWDNMVVNFTGFAPLGVVLVAMLGIGVAEHSGLIGALLKGMVLITPRRLMTPAVIFIGVMSSMALDAGYVVLPPLAAAVFARSGRSPLVGLGAVFAGVSAGFSANLLITSLDPLLQSFTQGAATILDPDYYVDVRCNYYFMIASTVLISFVGWFVTWKFVEPKFTADEIAEQIRAGEASATGEQSSEKAGEGITPIEKRGLLLAAVFLAVGFGLILMMIHKPGWSLNGFIEPRPGWKVAVWVHAMVPLLAVLFLLPGIGYGIAAGTVKSDRDIAKMMAKTMSGMGGYVVLAFFAGQFVAWFGESNLGKMIALEGVAILQKANMPLPILVIAIVLLSATLNIFIGSASAKWALISTVFVPIFMGVGITPELTQAAYRVGDSVTNSITPLNPYMVIILVFMRRYAPQAGVGSVISLMLPYTIAFLISWVILLVIWMALGIPLGPGGSPMFMEPIS
ncbi:MAG: AbgT family transporter [Pirellulaceae bacterium]